MWEEKVGSYSKPVRNEITAAAIKQFALAIGEPLPIYIDESVAKRLPHGKIIAPPTFPRTLQFGEIEGFILPAAGLIHGEQTYHYKRPLFAGDVVYGQTQLLSLSEKQSRTGKMLLIKLKQVGYLDPTDEKSEVFTSIRTLIMVEKLLKEVVGNE